ncbi:MAG: HEAT repeat domain-containing protein [Planctomycetota bacterium]
MVRAALNEPDEHLAWDAVAALHFRGTRQVLDRANELRHSSDVAERSLGADILGQLGVPDRTFPDDCVQILLEMLSGESDAEVLRAILIALGHLGRPEAIGPAVRFRGHPDPAVRNAVVFSLTGHDDPRAIDGLIELSRDEDAHVRDWATFGLGTQTEADTPAIREALVERLTDSYQDARCEAMVGLARRHDRRVIPAISRELSSRDVSGLVFEAAELIAAPELYPQLLAWRARCGAGEGYLANAITACSPSTRAD